MKVTRFNAFRCKAGFTLIEVSLVIGLLLALATFAGMNFYAVRSWQQGKDAAVSLQAVFAAQRAYLSDHPTADIAGVPVEQLQLYLPQGWTTMPAVVSLDDEPLAVDHTVMPPVLMLGASVYDPSSNGTDGLWDVGQ